MTKFPEDEAPTRPNSPAHQAAELVRDFAKLSKPDQSLVKSLIKALLGLSLLVLLTCSPAPEPIRPEPVPFRETQGREARATVLILSADTGQACCSGVSVLDARGHVVLLTASHCVTHKTDPDDVSPDAERTAEIGDVLGWRSGMRVARAVLREYDPVRDRATLEPDELAAPLPLAARKLCERCTLDGERVHAVSALYDQTSAGSIIGKVYAGEGAHWWESSMSVVPGWSGSPVLDDSGRVVGIVTKCNGLTLPAGARLRKTCVPGWSLFVDAL